MAKSAYLGIINKDFNRIRKLANKLHSNIIMMMQLALFYLLFAPEFLQSIDFFSSSFSPLCKHPKFDSKTNENQPSHVFT